MHKLLKIFLTCYYCDEVVSSSSVMTALTFTSYYLKHGKMLCGRITPQIPANICLKILGGS